jgi:hypothetical protein
MRFSHLSSGIFRRVAERACGGEMAETPGERLFLIRAALGTGLKNPMLIDDFVALVQRETGVTYDPSAISRTENGGRKLSLDDVPPFAAVDPLRRGKLWLAWGEQSDTTMSAARQGPSIIQENDDAIFDEPNVPEKKSAAKRKRRA